MFNVLPPNGQQRSAQSHSSPELVPVLSVAVAVGLDATGETARNADRRKATGSGPREENRAGLRSSSCVTPSTSQHAESSRRVAGAVDGLVGR